jgi:O-acetyl-ADP-ribose deacetylase (regulator of RNase III)
MEMCGDAQSVRLRALGSGHVNRPVQLSEKTITHRQGTRFAAAFNQPSRIWAAGSKSLFYTANLMLHTVTGDILLTKAQAIAHGVAPNDDFKQGLAFQLREHWPAMVKDYRHWCHNTHPKPGVAWMWGTVGRKRIINLLTQEPPHGHHQHPGKAHLEHINHALKALHQLIGNEGITSLALPRLATGVGGLDWGDVEPLIKKHLGTLKIPVYIYAQYEQGVQANEPGLA